MSIFPQKYVNLLITKCHIIISHIYNNTWHTNFQQNIMQWTFNVLTTKSFLFAEETIYLNLGLCIVIKIDKTREFLIDITPRITHSDSASLHPHDGRRRIVSHEKSSLRMQAFDVWFSDCDCTAYSLFKLDKVTIFLKLFCLGLV